MALLGPVTLISPADRRVTAPDHLIMKGILQVKGCCSLKAFGEETAFYNVVSMFNMGSMTNAELQAAMLNLLKKLIKSHVMRLL